MTCRARPTSTSARRRPVTFTGPDGESLPHYQFAPGPFTNFARVISFQSTAESRYNGVTVELNRRFAQGYQYRVAYTLGKVEDTVPDATAVVPEGSDDRKFASNPADFDADRAPGNNDQRHRFVGERDLHDRHVRRAIRRMGRGPAQGLDAQRDLHGAERPAVQRLCQRPTSTSTRTASTTSRPAPRATSSGCPEQHVVRPARRAQHRSRRHARAALIWEAFNLLNRANYNVVQQTLYAVDLPTRALTRNAQFGQFTAQADPRIMQLAVKLAF